MLDLLNYATSTCSQKVRLGLHEKGLAFTDTQVDLAKGAHLTPAYLAINPNGVVPTLLHDGRTITDSSVILEYLDEVFPHAPLSPDTPFGRADMRAWLRFFEEVPTVAIRYPSFSRVLGRRFASMSDEDFDRAAGSRPLRSGFYRKMGKTGFSEADLQASTQALALTLERMQRRLKSSFWLCGETLTLADICVAPTIDRMADLGMADMWADAPDVRRWFDALQNRPSYSATFYAGSRLVG